jgi:hypothetical protein
MQWLSVNAGAVLSARCAVSAHAYATHEWIGEGYAAG